MLREIVGLRIEVRALDARLKLSQNRTPDDRARVRERLGRGSPAEAAVAAWMRRTAD